MNKLKFIWGSPHIPTAQQVEELTKRGELTYMKDRNPELHKRMCTSSIDLNALVQVTEDLYEFLKENKAIVVQPAGSPAQLATYGELEIPMLFAHSERVSLDELQQDGTVKKTSIFSHKGWIPLNC